MPTIAEINNAIDEANACIEGANAELEDAVSAAERVRDLIAEWNDENEGYELDASDWDLEIEQTDTFMLAKDPRTEDENQDEDEDEETSV
jgi:hypothetical protein